MAAFDIWIVNLFLKNGHFHGHSEGDQSRNSLRKGADAMLGNSFKPRASMDRSPSILDNLILVLDTTRRLSSKLVAIRADVKFRKPLIIKAGMTLDDS